MAVGWVAEDVAPPRQHLRAFFLNGPLPLAPGKWCEQFRHTFPPRSFDAGGVSLKVLQEKVERHRSVQHWAVSHEQLYERRWWNVQAADHDDPFDSLWR